jgi:nucleoside-diphosphate-sugar epimerase
VVLFGANGRIGRAFAKAAARHNFSMEPISWMETKSQVPAKRGDIIARLAAVKGDVDVVFASGLTDPSASEAALMLANVERPMGLIEATKGDLRYRYLTIGSALETFTALVANNRYLASKAALWSRIEALSTDPRLLGRIVHLRGHTFYGGEPVPHSFLGQMYDSLRLSRPFRMSDGHQLREYAHVDDVASSIVALLARDWTGPVVIDLSTGEPVMLREVALAVFGAFRRDELLQLGALPTPLGENQDVCFSRSPAWLLGRPRPSIRGIIEWLSALLNAQQTG